MTEIKKAYLISLPTSERQSEEKGVFLNKEVGVSVAGKGWYGASAHASEIKVVQDSDGSWWEVSRKINNINTGVCKETALRDSALSKLSKEEREALGI